MVTTGMSASTVLHHFGCSTMSSSWSQSHSYPSPIAESVIPAPSNRDLKVETHEPTGLDYTWRLWRHCCCRYGWYPLVLAPLVTTGCMLSIYSAYGCNFILVEIGFLPSNGSWNESSSAQFGLFSYQSGQPETNKYREAFLDGCREYPDRFSDIFIDGDRTWKVARVMASISGIACLVGAVSWVSRPYVFSNSAAVLTKYLREYTPGHFLALCHQSTSSILLLAGSFNAFTCSRISFRRLKVSSF